MGAVSLAQGKAALTGYGGTADDSAITVELAMAEAQVAALCGWPATDAGAYTFETGTYTLYGERDPADKRRLLLPVPPVTVTSVHVTDSETYDSSSLLAATKYTPDGHSLYALDGQWWSVTPRGNKAVVTAGWDEGSAPDAIVAAVVGQLVHRWRILRTSQGMASVSQQGSTTTRDALVTVPMVVRQAAQLSPAWSWRSV